MKKVEMSCTSLEQTNSFDFKGWHDIIAEGWIGNAKARLEFTNVRIKAVTDGDGFHITIKSKDTQFRLTVKRNIGPTPCKPSLKTKGAK